MFLYLDISFKGFSKDLVPVLKVEQCMFIPLIEPVLSTQGIVLSQIMSKNLVPVLKAE